MNINSELQAWGVGAEDIMVRSPGNSLEWALVYKDRRYVICVIEDSLLRPTNRYSLRGIFETSGKLLKVLREARPEMGANLGRFVDLCIKELE